MWISSSGSADLDVVKAHIRRYIHIYVVALNCIDHFTVLCDPPSSLPLTPHLFEPLHR